MSIAGSSFGDQTDVAATVRALERELLAYPGQQFRPGNPGGVVRPGLLMCVAAAAIRGLSANGPADSLPAGGGLGPLTNVPNGQLSIAYTDKEHIYNELAVIPVSSLEIKP